MHKECYGWGDYDKDSFRCLACDAVGKRFQVDGKYKDGTRMTLEQKERPKHCELCSIDTGIHAMHPLFDNHGQKGRQIMMVDQRSREPRLA